MNTHRSKGSKNKGSFLLVGLVGLSFASTLITTMFVRSGTELKSSEQLVDTTQAFHLAEAGISDVIPILRVDRLQWNDELIGPDNQPNTSDDGILNIGSTVARFGGTYALRVFDNSDEQFPASNDPTTDADGVIRVLATGSFAGVDRQIQIFVRALFNYAIAAEQAIYMMESSATGSIHANRDIHVLTTSELMGDSQATATGAFIFGPGETLVHTQGDLVGGDPPLIFDMPDETELENSVTRWLPPNPSGVITLFDQEIVGVNTGTDIEAESISLFGAATFVAFGGRSITFDEKIGTVDASNNCISSLNVNIIALGGGSITFEETVCINGLVWAEGNVTLARLSLFGSKIGNFEIFSSCKA